MGKAEILETLAYAFILIFIGWFLSYCGWSELANLVACIMCGAGTALIYFSVVELTDVVGKPIGNLQLSNSISVKFGFILIFSGTILWGTAQPFEIGFNAYLVVNNANP